MKLCFLLSQQQMKNKEKLQLFNLFLFLTPKVSQFHLNFVFYYQMIFLYLFSIYIEREKIYLCRNWFNVASFRPQLNSMLNFSVILISMSCGENGRKTSLNFSWRVIRMKKMKLQSFRLFYFNSRKESSANESKWQQNQSAHRNVRVLEKTES